MLAAGGTGGHLFPAYALSEELKGRGYTIDLITDMRGDRYGTGFPARKVYQVPSATLAGRSPLAVIKTVWTLLQGTLKAYGVLGQIRPKVVVGFGGYPTFPPLVGAKLRGIPTLLHEQNAVMGRANRMLAPYVKTIATSFNTTKFIDDKHLGKVRLTGNPVRGAVIHASRQGYQPLRNDMPVHLLVFGGSQGARFFADTVPPALTQLPESMRQRLIVVQQCREEDLERVGKTYQKAEISAELAVFFKNLPERIAQSHLVIARAGASTVAELAILGRPAILVPLPHALDNDQLQNATRLQEAGGAWCIEQKALSPESLAGILTELLQEPVKLSQAAEAVRANGNPNAVAFLADLVEELAVGE